MGSLRSLCKRTYTITNAIKDISFTIEEGDLVGFIGPNGAGKTTTLKCLSGLLFPSSGTIEVLGYTPFDRTHEYLKKIALVMGQKNQLWWDLPAIETFRLNKEIYGIDDKKFKKTLDTLVELLNVSSLLFTQVRKLSLGERMKMELIASLIHCPKVLFLDEPTIGLDVVMQKNLRDFIRKYNETTHATIMLTSHYMEDVRQLCNRVIVIDHGLILYDGMLENLVKTFATHKILEIVFNKDVSKEKLAKAGEIVIFEFPKATIKVNREQSNRIASLILSEFPVEDLNIMEPDIEDVIRDVFTSQHS